MKKVVIFIFVWFLSIFALAPSIQAQANPVQINVFVRQGCVHCAAEEKFLDQLVQERTDVDLKYFRIENEADRKIWEELTTKIEIPKVTPITVIGESFIVGFADADTTGKQILQLIESTKQKNQTTDLTNLTPQSMFVQTSTCGDDLDQPCTVPKPVYQVKIPLIGQVNLQNYPLYALAAVLGFVDGFNPCAMWVLVSFLLILIQLGSRQKMLVFAGTFILAEAIMYYSILTVWFKTWNFIQLDQIVTPIVGLVSIGAGLFFLREWHKKNTECVVTDVEQRQKIRTRIKKLASQNLNLVTFIGILGLAFSVNVIEFACSIGIPQTFTKILDLNKPGFLMSQWLMFIYIFFYMIDDFIVFGLALWSANKMHLTSKYSQASHLVGGVLMILLGLIMLIKPGLLMFN